MVLPGPTVSSSGAGALADSVSLLLTIRFVPSRASMSTESGGSPLIPMKYSPSGTSVIVKSNFESTVTVPYPRAD
jgi:hypothetical protein